MLTYADSRSFKLFLLDVGLLGAVYGLDQDVVVEGGALYTQGKGAYVERYVCQQLVASNACVPYYWPADSRTDKAEADFLYECRGRAIPLEVRSDDNVRSESLAKFAKKFSIERCQRLSRRGFKDEGWLVNMPLFAANVLPDVL